MSKRENDYWRDVREIARDVLERESTGESTDRHEALHEAVDGSEWIIYYSKAAQVMRFTDNDNALEEETGGTIADFDSLEGGYWSAVGIWAYYAMLADCGAAMARLEDAE